MNLFKRIQKKVLYEFNICRRKLNIYKRPPTEVAIVDNETFCGSNDSDIADHLNTIFALAMSKKPKSILELGTRGGESTKVLTLVAELVGAKGYSVDLNPSPIWLNEKEYWTHFEANDIEFGQTLSKFWPNGDLFSGIDLLFLDTSHLYDHTKLELETYWKLINNNGLLILHDTNCTSKITRKLSGAENYGWNNQRGVIRALEVFFQCKFDENRLLTVNNLAQGAKALTHFPWNNGLTVIYK